MASNKIWGNARVSSHAHPPPPICTHTYEHSGRITPENVCMRWICRFVTQNLLEPVFHALFTSRKEPHLSWTLLTISRKPFSICSTFIDFTWLNVPILQESRVTVSIVSNILISRLDTIQFRLEVKCGFREYEGFAKFIFLVSYPFVDQIYPPYVQMYGRLYILCAFTHRIWPSLIMILVSW